MTQGVFIVNINEKILAARQRLENAKSEVLSAKVALAKCYKDRYSDGKFCLIRGTQTVTVGEWPNQKYSTQDVYYVLVEDSPTHKFICYKMDNKGITRLTRYPWTSRHSRKLTAYDSYEKLIIGADRLKMPVELINEFIDEYKKPGSRRG
jgi:hypothetical protein